MLNDNEPRHPLESNETKQHPLEAPPTRRVHPLEQTDTGAQVPQTRFAVAFPIARPYVTYTLIAINCVIFLVGILYPSAYAQFRSLTILFRPAVVDSGEYYRLFTSMFLHAGIEHLFFNMFSLFIIGRAIEWVFGWQRFLLVYLLGGLGGSVLFALTLDRNGSGLGASGAIFAIWGAEMVFLYRHRNQLGSYAKMQLRNIVVVALLNLFIGAANPMIGTWAHIGGLIGGAVLTWWVGPRLETRTHPDHPNVIVFTKRFFTAALLPVLIYCAVLAVLMVGGLRILDTSSPCCLF
jgi:rhomboid protease GluP